jgi:hypothetical protein
VGPNLYSYRDVGFRQSHVPPLQTPLQQSKSTEHGFVLETHAAQLLLSQYSPPQQSASAVQGFVSDTHAEHALLSQNSALQQSPSTVQGFVSETHVLQALLSQYSPSQHSGSLVHWPWSGTQTGIPQNPSEPHTWLQHSEGLVQAALSSVHPAEGVPQRSVAESQAPLQQSASL